MKKLIACLIGGLMLLSVAVTPVASTKIISDTKVLIDAFYTGDLAELMAATKDLKAGDTFTIVSTGPGGNAWICLAMMNYIDELEAKGIHVITEIYGFAASANAFIWLAGDDRRVHKGDMLMFHQTIPRGMYGNKIAREHLTEDQRLLVDHLNNWIRQRLLDIVQDTELVNDMLDADNNWYTGAKLIELGIAKEI